MLFSLSRGQYAPALLSRLSTNGVPHRALAISAAGMVAAILLAIFAPKNAFLLLYGTAVAGMFFVWIVILLTHLRFRQTISRPTLEALPLKLRAHPLPTLAGIAAIGAIALSTFWVDGLRYTLLTFAPFLLAMSVLYRSYRNRFRTNRV
jgi:L-asparagine transporter-like permease